MRCVAISSGAPGEHCGLVTVERADELTGEYDRPRRRWAFVKRFAVAGSSRLDPGVTAAEIASGLEPGVRVLVDVTRSGIEIARQIHRRARPFLIVEAVGRPRAGRGAVQVSRADLLGGLDALLNERRVRIDQALADQLRALRGERAEEPIPRAWRSTERVDDLVMALALAVWWLDGRGSQLHQSPPPRLPFEIEDPSIDRGRERLLRA